MEQHQNEAASHESQEDTENSVIKDIASGEVSAWNLSLFLNMTLRKKLLKLAEVYTVTGEAVG